MKPTKPRKTKRQNAPSSGTAAPAVRDQRVVRHDGDCSIYGFGMRVCDCGSLRKAIRTVRINGDEDNWYGCPLSRDGCSREIPKECDCGAETHNAEVVKLAVELETLLAKSLRPEH
jgi:hypothetical protein